MSIYKDVLQSGQELKNLSIEEAPSEQIEGSRTLLYRIDHSLTEGNTILFTGISPAVGTTSVLLNLVWYLATYLEQKNLRVLLIDGNTRSRSLHTKFGVDHQPGLARFFQEKFNSGLLHKDVLPGVDFLPAGDSDWVLPSLNDHDVKAAIDQLFQAYDYVLVDTPPMFTYTDALILGNIFKHFVLVLEYGKSKIDVTLEAKKRIEESGCKLIGGVINRIQHTIPEYIYKRI